MELRVHSYKYVSSDKGYFNTIIPYFIVCWIRRQFHERWSNCLLWPYCEFWVVVRVTRLSKFKFFEWICGLYNYIKLLFNYHFAVFPPFIIMDRRKLSSFHVSCIPTYIYFFLFDSIINDETLLKILALPVLVVLDEAYIEFSGIESRMSWVKKYENLIVLRTFSKRAGTVPYYFKELTSYKWSFKGCKTIIFILGRAKHAINFEMDYGILEAHR